jgi:predicted nucleotidyltransferase
MEKSGWGKIFQMAGPSDESTEQLLAAFRRRIDAKIQADLAEEDRVAQALREQVLTTVRSEISKARDQGLSGRIWLFGSFAWGQPGPTSDIDVLVEGDDASVARLIAKTTGREVHAIRVDEAPATLMDRVVTEGILL